MAGQEADCVGALSVKCGYLNLRYSYRGCDRGGIQDDAFRGGDGRSRGLV